MQTDLTDLVDFPRETLEIELKEWVDLDDPFARAKIARHLAALANHGGGYLIFGFQDDLTPSTQAPPDLANFNRDTFTAIVKKYLVPVFQCDVVSVVTSDGRSHPVVRIPGHGATPITAKADGPNDARGRPQGILSGAHYVRKPGPESAPATTPDDWRSLIRRCVLHDRDALLSEIAGVVRPAEASQPAASAPLSTWHANSHTKWERLLSQTPVRWPVDIAENHYQLSYMVLGADAPLKGDLTLQLMEFNNQVRGIVWTGWSMFYPFTNAGLAPTIHPEFDDGTGGDVLEASLLAPNLGERTLPDFWRVAADGRATLIRPYREDRPIDVRVTGRAAGTWLSPETVLRETAELLAHAYAMAMSLEGATGVAFKCSWYGLSGRQIDDFDPSIYWSPGHMARANHRTTEGEWSIAALVADRDAIVAQLACPILSLFGLRDCSAELVAGMRSRFIKL